MKFPRLWTARETFGSLSFYAANPSWIQATNVDSFFDIEDINKTKVNENAQYLLAVSYFNANETEAGHLERTSLSHFLPATEILRRNSTEYKENNSVWCRWRCRTIPAELDKNIIISNLSFEIQEIRFCEKRCCLIR